MEQPRWEVHLSKCPSQKCHKQGTSPSCSHSQSPALPLQQGQQELCEGQGALGMVLVLLWDTRNPGEKIPARTGTAKGSSQHTQARNRGGVSPEGLSGRNSLKSREKPALLVCQLLAVPRDGTRPGMVRGWHGGHSFGTRTITRHGKEL